MTLPLIPNAAINLPPAAQLNNAAPRQAVSHASLLQFTNLFGSLIEDAETTPPPKASPANPELTAFESALQSQTTPVPTQPPLVLSALLRLHVVPTSENSKAETTDDNDAESSGTSQSNSNQATAALPLPIQNFHQPLLAPAPETPSVQTNVPTANPGKPQLGPATAVLAPEPASPRVKVSADPAQPSESFSLAFAAKVTPKENTVGPSAQVPLPSQAPTQSPKQSDTSAEPDPLTTLPVAGSQKGSSGHDPGDPSPSPKQSEKSAFKQSPPTPTPDPAPSQPLNQVAPPTAPTTVPTHDPSTSTASTTGERVAESAPARHSLDTRPVAAALPEATAASKSEPVRDLSLRLGNTPSNQVEVKIQERAGELHVAVSSSNSELTSDLRQQVGELVGKLDRAGYHTETVRLPSTPTMQNASQASAGQQDLPNGNQQQQNPREQSPARQKKATQPQWLQEINTTFGPTAIQGEMNQ